MKSSSAFLRRDLSRVTVHASLIVASLNVASAAFSSPADYVKWTDTRQVGPFQIQATFPLAKYDKLFTELPDLQREITRTLGVPATTTPIRVFLFSDEAQYKAFVQRNFPQVPYRQALFVIQSGAPGVYTFEKVDLDIDLRHECTHALLHGPLPAVPLWLDEGLAKYFEVPASRRAFDHPYFDDSKWKWSLRLGMVRSIESLEDRENLTDMDAADYRYSWAWVHFMMHGPEAAHQTLVRHLAGAQSSAPQGKLSAQLAENVPNATEKMIQHFKHWQQH
jgi:hypothetical protein